MITFCYRGGFRLLQCSHCFWEAFEFAQGFPKVVEGPRALDSVAQSQSNASRVEVEPCRFVVPVELLETYSPLVLSSDSRLPITKRQADRLQEFECRQRLLMSSCIP